MTNIRTVTVTVGSDPSVLGDAATSADLESWHANVCAEIENKFGVKALTVKGSTLYSLDCDDPEIRSWLHQISQTDEWMQYLEATEPETIHTTTAADGTSHDDHERVRLVLGNRTTESIRSCARILELIDHAVSSGRLSEDDRDEAYRALCEHLGVDA